jgi:hypothetical protein
MGVPQALKKVWQKRVVSEVWRGSDAQGDKVVRVARQPRR